jgi:hypothetical protein
LSTASGRPLDVPVEVQDISGVFCFSMSDVIMVAAMWSTRFCGFKYNYFPSGLPVLNFSYKGYRLSVEFHSCKKSNGHVSGYVRISWLSNCAAYVAHASSPHR